MALSRSRPLARRIGVAATAAALLVVAGCSGSGDSDPSADSGGLTQSSDGPSLGGVRPSKGASAGTKPGAVPTGAGKKVSSGQNGDVPDVPGDTPPVAGTAPRKVAGPLGPGIAASTIKIGFVYASDLEKTNVSADRAFSGDLPDEKGDVLAMVKGFNALGGIAGRKILPVFYDNAYTSGKTTAQRDQEICSLFTEDNPVFAVEPYFTTSENQAACLSKKGTMLVYAAAGGATPVFDQDAINRFPNTLWMIDSPTGDRYSKPFVAQLKAGGYFTKGAKVGVLYVDRPASKRSYARSFKPALKAAGITVSQEAALYPASNPDELSTSETQTQNAVLRFAANQITHVIMFDVHGWTHHDGFMRYAEQQHYRPRYGLNTSAGPTEKDVVTGADLSPQFRNALYMSWSPLVDLAIGNPSSRTKQCLDMLRKAGRSVSSNIQLNGITLTRCEYMFFLKDGLDRAAQLNAKGFRAAMESLGERPGVKVYATRYGAGRHDGVARFQMAKYDYACHDAGKTGCWKAYSKPQAF